MGAAGLSFGHLLIVLIVIVLVFGTKKLRDVGGDLGAALRDFKAALGSDASAPVDRHPGQAADPVATRSASADAPHLPGQDSTNISRS
jgi:TatA/E family protein of Tat protein translocase